MFVGCIGGCDGSCGGGSGTSVTMTDVTGIVNQTASGGGTACPYGSVTNSSDSYTSYYMDATVADMMHADTYVTSACVNSTPCPTVSWNAVTNCREDSGFSLAGGKVSSGVLPVNLGAVTSVSNCEALAGTSYNVVGMEHGYCFAGNNVAIPTTTVAASKCAAGNGSDVLDMATSSTYVAP